MKTNYTNLETADATPNASSLIETFRAIGYDTETAIADLIDNSITAGASVVRINYNWLGPDTCISILDNGSGMNEIELKEALRPGTKNPLSTRNKNDLGRFGLGLKTASFSQCRSLTLASKPSNNNISYWTWDLDYVSYSGMWNLIKIEPEQNILDTLHEQNSGTIVLWKSIDKLTKELKYDEVSLNKFTLVMEKVKSHLSMVFHRFLERKELTIFFQDREIKPWNPFLTEEFRVQNFPQTFYRNNQVGLKGYVIKHKSAFSQLEFKQAAGIRGWNDHQGFYVYRNDRMLVSGSWLGLWSKEEHFKLARISIDISNEVDSEWQIDIKKAVARLPVNLKESIRSYAADVRAVAVQVYRTRINSISNGTVVNLIPIWKEFVTSGTNKWSFRINRKHPILTEILRIAETEPSRAIELLMRHLEETVPIKSIFIKEAEDSYNQAIPFESGKMSQLIELMHEVYKTQLDSGLNDFQAKEKLKVIEPFNHFPNEINNINNI